MGPLTEELKDKDSPVRRFLGERFSIGLHDVQRRYRADAPMLVVPTAPRDEANPGTVGTAADWLMRFVLYPRPSLKLATTGALLCGPRARLVNVLADIATSLGMGANALEATDNAGFTGPTTGSQVDEEHLIRACWFLALLTEVFRAGPAVAAAGPLSRFFRQRPSVDEVLHMAPPAAIGQLRAFRHVFETELVPQLATRSGDWYLGPVFADSALMNADGDLSAAGLLLDLKTTAAKPSIGVKEIFQIIGYALLDFDDAYQLTDLGIFSARYGYLKTWLMRDLLDELAGHSVSLTDTRQQFRRLLTRQSLRGA